MRTSFSFPYVLTLGAAMAILAACGGGSSGFSPTAAQPGAAARGVHPDHGRSWMSPEAKTAKELLYVTDSDTYDAYVFSYPKGTLVGTLTNQNNPAGMCSDKKGDVYITQLYGGGNVVEYAHGGTTPIKTLSDPSYEPGACSVDPKTGNLAVANIVSDSFGEGTLMIFTNGSGSGTLYSPPASGSWFSVNTVGYDDKSNAYFAGSCNSTFCAGVLPAGSSSTENVSLNEGPSGAGSVQWDGKYLTYSDSNNGTVYRYTFSGTNGTKVSSTTLDGLGQYVQGSWIKGKVIVAPYSGGALVSSYAYPGGGKAKKTISGYPIENPFGVVISEKKKKK
jgi:hypothetical protein